MANLRVDEILVRDYREFFEDFTCFHSTNRVFVRDFQFASPLFGFLENNGVNVPDHFASQDVQDEKALIFAERFGHFGNHQTKGWLGILETTGSAMILPLLHQNGTNLFFASRFKELSLIRHSLMLLLAGLASTVLAYHDGLSEAFLAKVRNEYGPPAENRLRRWQDLIHDNRDKTEREKLKIVNDFFNDALFVPDIVLWKKNDYWATPIEFIIHDAGDCEDFSIAKYFTLREMGVKTSQLRLTYVKSLTLNQAHMVLAYYSSPKAEPLILDNINKRIRPASQRTDLLPVYSFNGDSLWLARTRNEQLKAGKSSQLSLWKDLNDRIQRGF